MGTREVAFGLLRYSLCRFGPRMQPVAVWAPSPTPADPGTPTPELIKDQHAQQYASVEADEHADAQREREAPHGVSPTRSGCHRVYLSLSSGPRMVAVPERPSSRSQ